MRAVVVVGVPRHVSRAVCFSQSGWPEAARVLRKARPAPAPQPFFGLGLLGRLLTAYSSGAKEEDFGNCKCNRRTFHNKPEKEKDKVNI